MQLKNNQKCSKSEIAELQVEVRVLSRTQPVFSKLVSAYDRQRMTYELGQQFLKPGGIIFSDSFLQVSSKQYNVAHLTVTVRPTISPDRSVVLLFQTLPREGLQR